MSGSKKLAESLLDEGRMHEARVLYERLCGDGLEDLDACIMLAAIDAELGQFDSAEQVLDVILKNDSCCIDALLIKARMLVARGMLDRAGECIAEILEQDDTCYEAWELSGDLRAMGNDFGAALASFMRLDAAGLADDGLLSKIARCYTHMCEFDEALAVLNRIGSRESHIADLYFNLASQSASGGKGLDVALESLERVIEFSPGHEKALALLGGLQGIQGNYELAIDSSNAALVCNPDNVDALVNLGHALKAVKRFDESRNAYLQALDVSGDLVDAWAGLAHVNGVCANLVEAEKAYRRLLELDPDDVYGGRVALAGVLRLLGRFEEAEKVIEPVFSQSDVGAKAWVELGDVLLAKGDVAGALRSYEEGCSREPDNAVAVAGIASVHERERRYDMALSVLTPALSGGDVDHRVAITYAGLARHFGHHDDAIKVIEGLLKDPQRAGLERIELNFSLGRLYDSVGRYEEAISTIQAGSELKEVTYSADVTSRYFADQTRIFTKERLSQYPVSRSGSDVPVFIVGMPRSGTSLVEQVLSCHSQVFAAGELAEIGAMVHGLSRPSGQEYPECVAKLSDSALQRLSGQYLERLEELSSGQQRVTDKMPQNFQYLGLIQILFPRARIIHCRRNPVDTCLSCYFRNFAGNLAFSYSQKSLGEYYREYESLMEHWGEVLSLPILEVEYEAIVSDLESASRSIVEFCGLEWEDACLKYYDSDRVVRTASYDQVRQPIYTDSVRKWERYEPYIDELLQALNHDSKTAGCSD